MVTVRTTSTRKFWNSLSDKNLEKIVGNVKNVNDVTDKVAVTHSEVLKLF